MKLIDIAKLSTRMFVTNPARTWLTILGMGVGTGAVVTLVGLGFGLQGILLEKIVFGETLLSLNVTAPSSGVVQLNEKINKEFLDLENVKDVSPLASFAALITYEGLTGNVFLQGVNPSYLRYTGATTKAGELFKEGEDTDADSVLIAPSVLKLFGVKDEHDIIGKKVSFRVFVPTSKPNVTDQIILKKEFIVKGVTADATSLSAMILMSELTKTLTVTKYEKVQVRVTSSDKLAVVTEAILAKGFSVTALSKTVEQANKIFQGIQAILAAFGGIALIVSAIGMFNTMTVTLLERTSEIGVMRTIGASPIDIKILFVSEAVVVGFLGGIVGICIGVGIGMAVNLSVNAAASHFGGGAVSLFRFPFTFLAFISTFSAVVGFLTGVFPARKAAALNPLDAIRYK